jgi:hypothetical protein
MDLRGFRGLTFGEDGFEPPYTPFSERHFHHFWASAERNYLLAQQRKSRILGPSGAYQCLFRSHLNRENARNRAILEGIREPFSDRQTSWRRGRDSNPRYPFGYSGFQDRLFQPLTHLSTMKRVPAFHCTMFRADARLISTCGRTSFSGYCSSKPCAGTCLSGY